MCCSERVADTLGQSLHSDNGVATTSHELISCADMGMQMSHSSLRVSKENTLRWDRCSGGLRLPEGVRERIYIVHGSARTDAGV